VRAAALATLLAATMYAGDLAACAACGCGDPTLTVLGSEPPGGLHVRMAMELRHRTDRVGAPGVDEVRLSEQRLDLSIAAALHRYVFVLATLPGMRREIVYTNLAVRGGYAVGDAELRLKAFVLRNRTFAPRHLLAIIAGSKLPTGPRQYGPDGTALPPELQAGTGVFDVLGGVSYTFSQYPWAMYASAQLAVPTRSRAGARASTSLRSTLVGQAHVTSSLAVRGGVDTRLDGRAREKGNVEADSGGFITFGLIEGVASVSESLLLIASIRVPVWNALFGAHHEGPIAAVGAAYDF